MSTLFAEPNGNIDAAPLAQRRLFVSWALAIGPGILFVLSIGGRIVFRFGFTAGGGPPAWEWTTWALIFLACPWLVVFNAIRVSRQDVEVGYKIAAWIAAVVSLLPARAIMTFSI